MTLIQNVAVAPGQEYELTFYAASIGTCGDQEEGRYGLMVGEEVSPVSFTARHREWTLITGKFTPTEAAGELVFQSDIPTGCGIVVTWVDIKALAL